MNQLKPINIAVVLGSKSDLEVVKNSKLPEILDEVSQAYDISIISAHRNPYELSEYCQESFNSGAQVFIGVAGMAAALPGAIAANLNRSTTRRPVIGVPLASGEFPDAQDALLSMVRMPPGMPVAVCGIGKSGLQNAALLACQIVAITRVDVYTRLDGYMERNMKPPELDIRLFEGGK
ncbi:MAG: AIR carboxylase family protein [Patescibacteria group bacterium]